MEGALGGSASVEGGGHSPSWWGDGTLRRDGRQHAHVHRMWQKVYRQGRWWWREVSAPARSAGRAHELVQDSPMQPWVEHVSGTDGLTQHVQHAGAHGGLVRARTFDGSGDRACEAQAGARDVRGAGFCKEGACAAREVAGSPSAERAPARIPSVEPGVAVSRKSSQSTATTETILRDGHGAYQAEERRGKGFRRVASGVSGVLRMTREAADAMVQRAKRFFFRDEG